MKKRGVLNKQLAGLIAGLGHMETFLVGDAGMPIPPGVEVVDLAVCCKVPTFRQVMDAILEETQVEYFYVAEEIEERNPELFSYLKERLPGVAFEEMPHAELKKFTAGCKFAVRTGEDTPYPNVVLRAGVVF